MTKSLAVLGAAASLLFSAVEAHNAFTTLWINGKSQGDATCVRTTKTLDAPNSPVRDFTSNDIVCGFDGIEPVAYTCAAPQGATLTFEYRISPNQAGSGFIDPSHKGPAAVYAKKIESVTDSGVGDGWFKIWSEGYDMEADKWATEKLIDEDGLLSINIPAGLPAGNYLFRPEAIAMHNTTPEVEPQFYVGCAQVFLESSVTGDLVIPEEYSVSMPGYIQRGEHSVTYNIYDEEEYSDPKVPYPQPGPEAWVPPVPQSSSGAVVRQTEGAIPDDCLIVNGNWCGVEVASYQDDLQACWAAQSDCWAQADVCWDMQPITGGANCELWGDKCTAMGDSCDAGVSTGPPEYDLEPAARDTPSFAAPKNAGDVASTIIIKPTSTAQPSATQPVAVTTTTSDTIEATSTAPSSVVVPPATSVPTTLVVTTYPSAPSAATTTSVAAVPTTGPQNPGCGSKTKKHRKGKKSRGHKKRHQATN